MSLKARIIQGVFWSLAANALSKLLNFFAMVLVARIFGPNDFGIFDLLRSSLVTFGVFSGMGIGLTATKYIATYYKEDKQKTGSLLGTIYLTTLLTTFIIVTIIFIFSKEFSTLFLNDPNLENILRLGLLLLISNTFFTLQNAILSGFERFKSIAKINFYAGVINIPLVFFFAQYEGVQGVIIAMTISGALQVFYGLYTIITISKEENITISFYNFKNDFVFLWKFAFPTFVATFMVTPTILICKSIIAHTPNGYESLGIFSAAFTIQSILILFSVTLNSALLPILISESKNNNPLIKTINIYISWIMGVVIATPVLLLPEITTIIYGKEYFTNEYIITLKLLMLAFIIYMFKESIRRMFIIQTKMWFSVLDNFIWGVILITATLIFSSKGSIGLAIAYLLAYSLSIFIMIPILYKNKMFDKELFLSKYSLFLWLFIGAITLISFLDLSLFIKLFSLFAAFSLVGGFILFLKKVSLKGLR